MALVANVPGLRRPDHFNKKCTVNLYHRTDILEEVEAALLAAGGESLVARFKAEGPFGRFLEWRPGQSYGQTVHSILCRALSIDGGMFFALKGGCIEFTASDFALVTGLHFGESSWDPNDHLVPKNSRLHQRIVRKGRRLARDLLGFINTNPTYFEKDHDTLLGLANVLIANSFILGHDIKSAPFPWLWHLADDPAEFNRFPWGAYSFLTLRYYVEHAQDKPTYHFYGPAWALIVWGYEVIGGMADYVGILVDEDIYPRCVRWTFGARPRGKLSHDEFFQVVDDPGYPIGNIQPTQWEYELGYFRSSLVPNYLDVHFYTPAHVTAETAQFPPEARPRRPLHDPDDILDTSEGRPRRSTQSRAYMGEDQAEHTSGRGSKSRRDPGKRPREASSSGSRGHDVPQYATPDEVRAIMREEIAEQNQEIDRKLNGFMDKVKSYFEEVKALLSCKSSSIPRSVSQPSRGGRGSTRGGRPPIVSSARPSSARPSGAATTGAGGSRSSGIEYVTAEVGDRRDTTLPLYTDSGPSEPYTTLGSLPEASSSLEAAWDAFTGQSSTYIPPFTQYMQYSTYQDFQPGRFSLPENISSADYTTSTAPNVTVRDPARSSTSRIGRGQSSGFGDVVLKAVSDYIPTSEPAWPKSQTVSKFNYWYEKVPYGFEFKHVPDQIAPITIGVLKQMVNDGVPWDALQMDLALMTLRKQLHEGTRVFPQYVNGHLMILNTHVMVDLKASYERVMHGDVLRRSKNTPLIKHDWIVENWNPSEYLCNLPRNINPTFETTNWWNAETVILPWVVQGDRFISIHVWLKDRQLHVMDPVYWSLDKAGKLIVKKDLGPLIVLMSYWLVAGGYYENNVHGITEPKPEDMGFTAVFRKNENMITSQHPRCSGVVACLNVEHLISGSPSIEAGTNNCCKYKKLYATRIFGYADTGT